MQIRLGQEVLSREDLLDSAGLLVEFTQAKGDMLTWKKDDQQHQVLDLVGGFGSTLLGHNHPELVQTMQQLLSAERPMWVQGAQRPMARQLRAVLADKLYSETQKQYQIILLNTGTEAVEAALKHAQYEYFQRLSNAQKDCAENWRTLLVRLSSNHTLLNRDFFTECEQLLEQEPIETLDELKSAIEYRNQIAFNLPSKVAAFKGAFHGKTRGSLATTYNRDARLPFISNNTDTTFINDTNAFIEKLNTWQSHYWYIEFSPVRLVKKPINQLAALIYEPIQGEGGVVPLSSAHISLLQNIQTHYPDTAIIADEIQCGLGRTGSFLESSRLNTPNDYITLAKSLGGGLCKISAIAIEKSRYHKEFSMLHSTTFSDDDLSSAVAIKTLALIDRDDIEHKAKRIGDAFLSAFSTLAKEYPDMIAHVRGSGCMLGIELASQANHPSATIANLDSENVLSMTLAGYLLHKHHIRVLPSLGKRKVLRMQPSGYFCLTQIPNVVSAFRTAFDLIRSHQIAPLLAHLIHSDVAVSPCNKIMNHPQRDEPISAGIDKVAFISHLIDLNSLNEIDPGWEVFDEYEQEELNQHILPVTIPSILARRRVTSNTGKQIELVLFGIQMDAESIEADRRFNQAKVIRSQVHEAYRLAREEGCKLVGFGGYTSIVTNNCCDFTFNTPAATSGNALTVAASINTVLSSAVRHGIDLEHASIAICGAAGNIGQVHSAILAKYCQSLLLITRSGSANNINKTLNIICENLYLAVDTQQKGGRLLKACRDWLSPRLGNETPSSLIKALQRMLLARQLITVSEQFETCQTADVIVSNTSSPATVFTPAYIAQHKPVLISDVAVPKDVPEDIILTRPNVKLIRGGVVNLPNNPHFTLPGMLLPSGQVYACCGETMLLGLAGIFSHFSMGALTCSQVEQVQALAAIHGFELDQEKPQNDTLQAAS
ncbi:aminotransferase class III-fold pyridoxal phosphate-dependent enzyme [Pseudoalteromonas sp. MMG013]|uniref:aminotransferase class III-fold pyridoxal phosphate-dependent enzyme n=1 Tax=Pseudoalteromonas sp. MMG013 TaxID=2822687 RepID=UPI001B362DAE|nr:aminotransferase class III-fold pyridoxal phosphate-dependent enzyme [Pseudoalteromonas sp. MMG013]MBQ4863671.1 aminotransferase class III-fold pyridoxal phosphate-dependent enzyme [Pseudoalteromonas sp. MMG013]